MPVPYEAVLSEFSAEDQADIRRAGAEIAAADVTLAALRKKLGLTQAQIAAALETSQANVAKIEGKGDVMVSTVARVVEALGGTLQLVVKLPGFPTTTLSVGQSAARRTKRARAA